MLTFLDWIKDQNLNLDVAAPRAEKTVEPEAARATTEDRKRTGYSGNYPPAYVSAQYPHKYFNPSKATADLDKKNMK